MFFLSILRNQSLNSLFRKKNISRTRYTQSRSWKTSRLFHRIFIIYFLKLFPKSVKTVVTIRFSTLQNCPKTSGSSLKSTYPWLVLANNILFEPTVRQKLFGVVVWNVRGPVFSNHYSIRCFWIQTSQYAPTRASL